MMRTLILLLSLSFSTFVFSQSNASKKELIKDIESTATVEEAWQLLTDVATWKQWDSHAIDAKIKSDFKEKGQGKLVTHNAHIVDFAIIEFEQDKTYTLRHKLSSGTLYIKRSVVPTDVGSKLTVEVWYKGLSPKNFRKYMGEDYATTLENELQEVKQLLEN